MTGRLRHRGPDGEGAHLAGGVGLGHRRLSIIDLVTGAQPLANEDGTVWITYNGEVYNFPGLREQLLARGHEFRTRSDTEVIVHLYEDHGPRCVEHLRGMFAFAIWDARAQQMLLARDRLGKKPLYYLHDGRRLVFASELKSILLAGGVDRAIDPVALEAYLTLDYIPAPLTIYRGIKKLPPATVLVCRDGALSVHRYWTPALTPAGRPPRVEDYAEELWTLLREAVRLRLISDVPIGVLLSGGIDSSTIVAAMAQVTDQPIRTYSIGSPRAEMDELPYARLVARQFGTQHHEFIVEPDALAVLPDLLDAYDEPFADASAIPTYYVCKLARQHVTVALSGDGGDELFAGYPWYALLAPSQWMMRIPSYARTAVLGRLYQRWPDRWRGKGRLYFWQQPGPGWWYAATRNRFAPHERRRLLTPAMRDVLERVPPCDVVARAAAPAERMDPVAMMQYADLMTYLPEDLLVKVDRASMQHGLEVRTPLLDHRLVEFVLQIPSPLKLTNGDSKHILKRVVSRWLPSEVLSRPKMGFGIPLRYWFADGSFNLPADVLLDHTARQRGIFQRDYVQELLGRHRSGRSDATVTTHQIWNLLILELWLRRSGDAQALPVEGPDVPGR